MSKKPETIIRTVHTVLHIAESFDEVEQAIYHTIGLQQQPFVTLHIAGDNIPIMINISTITLAYPDTDETKEPINPLERILT